METIKHLDARITDTRLDPFGGHVCDFEAIDDAALERMERREADAREAAIEREERPWRSAQGMRELQEKWDAERKGEEGDEKSD